MIEERAR